MKILSLGLATVALRKRLLLAAWLVHAFFALAAAWPAAGLFRRAIAQRPVFSREVLSGFSLDLLVELRAAHRQEIAAYVTLALVLAMVYGAAKLVLDAVILPAYLSPLERLSDGRWLRAAARAMGPLLRVGAVSAAAWLLLWYVAWAAKWLAAVAAGIALLLRVLFQLWKCAVAGGNGGLAEAWAAAARNPPAVLWLILATAILPAAYALLAGAVTLFTLGADYVVTSMVLGQLVVAAGILLRLWLLASAAIVWRAAAPPARMGG
jgi:hypothetical protein